MVAVALDIGDLALLHVHVDAAAAGAHVARRLAHPVRDLRGRVEFGLMASHRDPSCFSALTLGRIFRPRDTFLNASGLPNTCPGKSEFAEFFPSPALEFLMATHSVMQGCPHPRSACQPAMGSRAFQRVCERMSAALMPAT